MAYCGTVNYWLHLPSNLHRTVFTIAVRGRLHCELKGAVPRCREEQTVIRKFMALALFALSLDAGAQNAGGAGSIDPASGFSCEPTQTAGSTVNRLLCAFTDSPPQPADGENLVTSWTATRQKSPDAVDWRAGIKLSGEGTGAARAIVASVTIPNPLWRAAVAIVDVQQPQGIDAVLPQFREAAAGSRIKNAYYHLRGGQGGEHFFRACETYKIACYGSWGPGGGEADSLVDGPFNDPMQQVRLDQVLPVFTNSSANAWGGQGHYNLGLSWNSHAIVSNEKVIIVPLRYRRVDAAEQPQQASFDVTLRRIGAFAKMKGKPMKWSLQGGAHKGRAIVAKDGSITLKGITLTSSEEYTGLWVAPAEPRWKLVYTRQPRANKPVPGTPVKEAANWQHATDVGRINGGIAEADVVIDDLAGNIKVIHDCTTAKEICVAHEARVSPDGSKVIYSVGYGNKFEEVMHDGVRLGIKDIPGFTHARLWIYDLKTGKKHPVPHHPARAIDRQPEWISNDKIVFSSSRGNTYPFRNQFGMHLGLNQFGQGRCFNYPDCVSQDYGHWPGGKSMQLWTMNIDGTDARNITPHENMALAPSVMSNGDILYSCWNAHENKSFDTAARNSNNPSTSKNKWWLCRTDGNGADGTVILLAHKPTQIKTREWLPRGFSGGEHRSELRAIRSVAEIHKGELAVTSYYRANHLGSMGIIYRMDYNDPHVEGCSTARCYPDGMSMSNRPGSGRYVPSSFRAITPYGVDQDIDVRRDNRNRALGKSGYPAPLPNTDKEILITHGRGTCYEVTPIPQANRVATGGEPTCQKGIYKVKVPMVTNPFDKRQMVQIAGGPQWHAWDARAIATFQSLHGQPMPDQLEPLNPNEACYLQVVDARQAELAPAAERYDWLSNLYEQCAFQGCAVNTENPRFHANNMAALTIFLPEMWDVTFAGNNREMYKKTINSMGHKSIATLGSQPLLADGSVKMRVPCETPIVMAGTDAQGRVIAHDAMLHSLRKGETRTCHGCHDGHSEERARELGSPAVERIRQTMAYNTKPPMPKKAPPVTFDQVRPILEKRCSGCHKDMIDNDGLLYSRVAQDFEQHDWRWAKKQPAQGEHSSVTHVLIQNPGRGYAVGEQLAFKKPGAKGKIAKVDGKGRIRAIRLMANGSNYPHLSKVGVKTAAGQGASLVAMTDKFYISRPYTSKWVAKFARDSLLYWKCVDSRQDGRTDAQYRNDIDFGRAHNSGATPQECAVIARWIDTGVQR